MTVSLTEIINLEISFLSCLAPSDGIESIYAGVACSIRSTCVKNTSIKSRDTNIQKSNTKAIYVRSIYI